MGRVLTNATGLRATIEASTGVLPASPEWWIVEFENIGAYGAVITTVPRRPISQDRGRKKGAVTDLDSSAEFETDLTLEFARFAEGFVFAEYANVEFDLRSGGASPVPPPAIAATDDFTIDAASALLAAKMQWVATMPQTLLWAQGYLQTANNGIHVLSADVLVTEVAVQVTSALVDETPPTNASLQVAGIRTDDVTVTVNANGTGTLVSAADITDWSTLGLFPGMELHIGGLTNARVLANAPTIAAVITWGPVRITSIVGGTLNFDKAKTTRDAAGDLIIGSSVGTETVDFMFGRFARNVPVTNNAPDDRYLERTYQFEVSFPGLSTVTPGEAEFEYAIGNFANEVGINLPLTNKATLNLGFIGTNSDPVALLAARKTNAAAAVSPLRTTAFNTSSDLVSISTDLISAVSDVCFKSMTLTLLNSVSPEKCLGTLGAVFINAGLFEANLEGQLLFTTREIVEAIRNNTTVTMAAVMRNDNGMIAFDMPEMTLGGGGREFPVDQSVLVSITGGSFTDTTFGHDIGITIFPAVPLTAT